MADWHLVALFGSQAELAFDQLKKGAPVYIEGRLRTRPWKNRADEARHTTEVIAEVLQLLQSPLREINRS